MILKSRDNRENWMFINCEVHNKLVDHHDQFRYHYFWNIKHSDNLSNLKFSRLESQEKGFRIANWLVVIQLTLFSLPWSLYADLFDRLPVTLSQRHFISESLLSHFISEVWIGYGVNLYEINWDGVTGIKWSA